MEMLACAGILVGAALMPIIPVVGDDEAHLGDAIRAVKDHGGSFVLAGGLTMAGAQAERTLNAARRLDPALAICWRQMYNWSEGGTPSYSPPREYNARLGLLVRELCARHGLADRMPRYIPPGPLAINKKIAEQLFLKTYDLELEQADEYHIRSLRSVQVWAYRKAAWTVDELPESIAELYRAQGEEGLRKLSGIGKSMAAEIAGWLRVVGTY
jgi:hypothetical protein